MMVVTEKKTQGQETYQVAISLSPTMWEAIELIKGRAVPLVLATSRSAHINFCINILTNDEWVVSSKLFAWNQNKEEEKKLSSF
jgi:hypothetical protein